MKRILINLIALLLLFQCVLAEDAPLSRITINEGWMSGTVTAHYNLGYGEVATQEIKVDCAEPEKAYPAEILTVSNRYISKEEMQQALESIGQSTHGQFVNHRNSTSYIGDWNTNPAADISKEDAAVQAAEIGLAYFDALGIEVENTPRNIERPNDLEAYLEKTSLLYTHIYSDPSVFLERAKSQWQRMHRYETNMPNYTTVHFTILLDGMRLWPTPSYPANYTDEPDAWVGYSVSAFVTVSDSGILVEAGTSNIPSVASRRPMTEDDISAYIKAQRAHGNHNQMIAGRTWQDALSAALADSANVGSLIGNSEEYMLQDDNMTDPITRYGSRGVITGITPYLFTIAKDEWMPMWHIECTSEYADGFRLP